MLLFNIYNKVTFSSTNRSVDLSSNYIYQGLTRRKTSYDNTAVPLSLFKEKIVQYANNQFLLLFSELFFDFANTSYSSYLKDIKYLIFTNTSFENKLLMLLSELHKNKNMFFIRYLYLKVQVHIVFI